MDSQEITQVIGDEPPADEALEDVAAESDEAPPPAPKPPTVGQLRRERKRLWDDRQEAIYHIGGLALELERREQLADPLVARRVEVVKAMDSRVAEIDAELAEIDDRRRRGRAREPEPTGYCMSCGAPHLADANFCARCGARIHVVAEDGDTQIIEMMDPE